MSNRHELIADELIAAIAAHQEELIQTIAKWIEQLPENHEPSDRGIGHTTTYIQPSRERVAQLIRARAWTHQPRCMVNRSSACGPCTCEDEK